MQRFMLYTLCLQIIISSFFIGASDTYVWGPLCIGYIFLFLLCLFDKLKNERKFLLPKSFLFLLVLFLVSLTVQNFLPPKNISIPGTFDLEMHPLETQLSSSFLFAKLSFYQLFMPVIVLVIIPYVLRSQKDVKILLLCMVLIPCIQGILGLFQYAAEPRSMLKGFSRYQGLTGTYVTRNVYACMLVMGFPLILGQLVYMFTNRPLITEKISNVVKRCFLQNSRYILFLIFSSICMFVSVVLSYSRTGIVFSFLSVVLFLLIYTGFQKKNFRRYIWLALIFFTFVAVIFFVVAMKKNAFFKYRFSKIEMSYRLAQFTTAGEMIQENPWFGSGGGQLRYHFELYRELPISIEHNYLENSYLQFCVEYGLVPCAIGLLIFILWARIVFGKRSSNSRYHNSLWCGCIVSLFMCMAFSMIHFSLYINGHRLFAAYLMGVLLSMKLESEFPQVKNHSPKKSRE